MVYRCKKYLSLLLTIAILNSSIQPLYASFPEQEDDVVRETKAQARMMMVEEALQAKVKTTASFIESWAPSFIKRVATKLGNWFESTLKDLPPSYFAKSPLEIDYSRDRAYWLAHFSTVVDEIKDKGLSSDALQTRLTELQDMVLQGVLSPYVYEKGLKELEESGLGSRVLFKTTREEFKSALKTAPGFMDQTFRHEASLYIHDLLTGHGDAQEFISYIRYYRDIDNALDYNNTLAAIRSYLREHKGALKITRKDYDAIIATLNWEIGRIAKDEKKRLKADQAFSVAASSVLPYYGQEWDEIHRPTNNALAEPLREKGLVEDYLDASAKALRKLVHTGAKYAQDHPTQTIMMVLAGQVVAAAAWDAFTVNIPKALKRSSNSLDATNDVPMKEMDINEQSSSKQALKRKQSLRSFASRQVTHTLGDIFQLNQNITCSLQNPFVAGLTNGNVFVAWDRDGSQTGDWDIYGRVFSANGTALGPEFSINQNTTNDQNSPSIADLTNGNVFVAWNGYNLQTEDWDIYGRVFSANGTALMSEFSIHQTTIPNPTSPSNPNPPSVVSLTNGNVFVAWSSYNPQTGDGDIYGRIFSANGTALMSEFGINEFTADDQEDPVATSLKNNNIFVMWRSSQTEDIYGRLFAANGTALSNEFSASIQHIPSMVSLTNSNVFVAWNGYNLQTDDWDIYGRIFSANGTALMSEFGINQVTTSNQKYPVVTGLKNDNIFVVWQGNQSGNWNIYGRIFSANGTALMSEFGINEFTADDQSYPIVTSLTNGNAFVVWQTYQNGCPVIYGRIFSMDETSTSASSTTEIPTVSSTTAISGTFDGQNSGHEGDASTLITGLAVGIGAPALLGTGAFAFYKYYLYKRSKSPSYTFGVQDSTEMEDTGNPSDPFGSVNEGVLTQRTMIKGQLRGGLYELLTDITPKLAATIKTQTGIKIAFTLEEAQVKKKRDYVLGEGQFGKFLVARNVQTKEIVGAKQVKGETKIQKSLKEGQIQATLNHLNVMPLLDYINYKPEVTNEEEELEPALYQIMPLAGFGNGVFFQKKLALVTEISKKEQILGYVATGLLQGLSYLHSLNFYHLDFKNNNFVLMRDGTPKIIDFGCTKQSENPDKMTGGIGDTSYYSVGRLDYARFDLDIEHPEKAAFYSPSAADAWAFGVTLLEMWEDLYPFDAFSYSLRYKTWDRAYFKAKLAMIPSLQNSAEGSLMDLTKKMLIIEDKDRMKVNAALQRMLTHEDAYTLGSEEERAQLFAEISILQESLSSQQPRVRSFSQSYSRKDPVADDNKEYGLTYMESTDDKERNYPKQEDYGL